MDALNKRLAFKTPTLAAGLANAAAALPPWRTAVRALGGFLALIVAGRLFSTAERSVTPWQL
jgi:hypothetical protein